MGALVSPLRTDVKEQDQNVKHFKCFRKLALLGQVGKGNPWLGASLVVTQEPVNRAIPLYEFR